MADDDEWAPFERPDEIATAEVDKVKDKCTTTALDDAQRAARAVTRTWMSAGLRRTRRALKSSCARSWPD